MIGDYYLKFFFFRHPQSEPVLVSCVRGFFDGTKLASIPKNWTAHGWKSRRTY